MRQAIILAGGFGTRLQKVVKDNPKPMAPIQNRPFLFYLLSYLKKNKFTDIVISVGYLKEQIIEYFGDNFLGMNISYAIEEKPLGTGGAIINSLQNIDQSQPVVVLNGDTFIEIDYDELLENHDRSEKIITIALKNIENSSRYGFVEIQNGIICSFKEKSLTPQSGYINSGVYVIDPAIFTQHTFEKKFSFETDFLVKCTKILQINTFKADNYFIDIGIPEDYQRSQAEIPQIARNKALFLDRDGVINIDHGHVGKIEDFDFVDGIFELCQKAQNSGHLIVIITNQAGIAKGYYSEEDFLTLTSWMETEFRKNGVTISKTYYCPYHIEGKIEKYKKESEDRKPNPGMILKAIKEFNIDPNQSILIGDKDTDIEAGERSGVAKLIKFTNEGKINQVLSEEEF